MPSTSPIVVLDSGLGGLTVVRALLKALPAEQIVYFGDTARLPYGTKSAGTVATFVSQIIQLFAAAVSQACRDRVQHRDRTGFTSHPVCVSWLADQRRY